MLIGEYNHIIDPKKRLAIPARLRKEIGEKAILTRGLDQCLSLFPLSEWEKYTSQLTKLPMGKGDARTLNRMILGGAVEVELDSLGRILIPDYLRQFAGLKQKAVIAGLYNRLEIWDEERWNAYKVEAEKNQDMIAEKLSELGLY